MLWWGIVELEGSLFLLFTLSFNNDDVVNMYACEAFINGRHIHGKPKLLDILLLLLLLFFDILFMD